MRAPERLRMRTPSHHTNSAAVHMVGRPTPLERHGLDVRETLLQRRRLELALQAELRAGTEGAGIAAGRAAELLGRRAAVRGARSGA